MMFSYDNILEAIKEINLENETKVALIEKLQSLEKEIEEEKENSKVPRRRTQHVVVTKGEGVDMVACVFTIGEMDDPNTLLDSMRGASVDSNQQRKPKSKKGVIKTFSDTLAGLKAKFLKERGVKSLVKEWVRTIPITTQEDEEFLKAKVAE